MSRTQQAEDAILLASANDAVADFLVKRGIDAEKRRWGEDISEEAEAALLERGERLIDLRLAQYCLYSSTARTLFLRDSDDWALRSLLLSNEAMSKGRLMDSFPECLFENEKGLINYLSAITRDDAFILFKNPTLDDRFLENVLSLDTYWQAMPADTRPFALSSLGSNSKMQKEVQMGDHADGWGWFMAGKPFEHAWRLVIELEATTENARHLAQFYQTLARYCIPREGILEAIPRWKPQSDDEIAKETKENERQRLSKFQIIRRAASAMLVEEHEVKQEELLASDDAAIRAGAYAAGKFTPSEMDAAVNRDGWIAAESFMENPNCWRTEEHRDQLREGLSALESEWSRLEYDHLEEKHRADHPRWFDLAEIEIADEDRPLTESSIGELTRNVVTSSSFTALSGAVGALAASQKIQFWLLLIILAVLIFR